MKLKWLRPGRTWLLDIIYIYGGSLETLASLLAAESQRGCKHTRALQCDHYLMITWISIEGKLNHINVLIMYV
jgi:hypothetical protein